MKPIKITNLLNESYINNSVMDEVKQCHPKQIICATIPVPIWKIVYKYLTQRNNEKTATNYIIKDESAWDCIDNEFNIYINRFNEENPKRKLSNVKILDCEFLGTLEIGLE